jgi:hypothetical protein
MSEEQSEAILTAEEVQSVASRYGASAKVWEINGRRWVVPKPTRPQWQAYKCDLNSADPTTKADASVALARSVIRPFATDGTVEKEREAFDTLGEEYPALLDLLGALADQAGAGPLVVRELKLRPSTPPV